MKKSKKAFWVIVGVSSMLFWSSLAVSCITEETAYRIGYDIGSSLRYEGERQANQQLYSANE